MSWYRYAPYVPVAERKAKAARAAAKMAKKGVVFSPVVIDGKAIAKTFWGKAWCDHLESHSDFENRLPRGRTYVRSGAVIDLQITKGEIHAKVQGSSLYQGHLHLSPLSPKHWAKIKAECAGKIDSMVELLQGKFSASVMEIMTRKEGGLFPKPSEIKFDCSCPDSAELCKHLAAVFYGIGSRLDHQPELLFLLRGVDPTELIGAVTQGHSLAKQSESTLDENLSEIFGIEMAEESVKETKKSNAAQKKPLKKPTKKTKKASSKKKSPKKKPPTPRR